MLQQIIEVGLPLVAYLQEDADIEYYLGPEAIYQKDDAQAFIFTARCNKCQKSMCLTNLKRHFKMCNGKIFDTNDSLDYLKPKRERPFKNAQR